MVTKNTYNTTTLKALGNLVAKDSGKIKVLTEGFISTLGLKGHVYLADQAQAYLVSRFPFNGKDTFKGLAQDPVALGSYSFLKYAVGSILLDKQTEKPQYSAFVPLVLQGYKKFSDIPYSKWVDFLDKHISPDLYTALVKFKNKQPEYSDNFLKEREGLLENSRYKSLKSMSRPKGPVDLENGYSNCMYYQTWLAHPEIIHKDMLFNLTDPDKILEPCVPTDSVLTDSIQALIDQAVKEAQKTVKYPVAPVADTHIPPWEA